MTESQLSREQELVAYFVNHCAAGVRRRYPLRATS